MVIVPSSYGTNEDCFVLNVKHSAQCLVYGGKLNGKYDDDDDALIINITSVLVSFISCLLQSLPGVYASSFPPLNPSSASRMVFLRYLGT